MGFGAPTDEHPCKTFEAIQIKEDIPCSLIWVKDLDACRGSYFCHEVGHAAMDIFAFIGAEPDVKNQEPFAYLLGTLFRLLNGAFNEFKDYKPNKSKKKK